MKLKISFELGNKNMREWAMVAIPLLCILGILTSMVIVGWSL